MIQPELLELEIDELIAADDLDAAVLRYGSLKADLSVLETQAKRLGAHIVAKLFEQGETRYAIEDVGSGTIGDKVTRTIQPGILLAHGVEASVIEAATKVSHSAPFFTWRRKGEKASDE